MKFLGRLSAACRIMHFAKSTEDGYRAWVADYLRFRRHLVGAWVHPDHLREPAIERFLTEPAVARRLAASSQNQAMCALVFFYRDVLGRPLGRIAAFRAEQVERLSSGSSLSCIRPPAGLFV